MLDLTDEITSHPFDEDFGVYNTKAGDDVTAASIDPCPVTEGGGEFAQWILFTEENGVVAEDDHVDLAEDGSWDATFKAPNERGFYFFVAACFDGEEGITGFYNDLILANEVTGTPPVRPPAPAEPIDEPPPTTG